MSKKNDIILILPVVMFFAIVLWLIKNIFTVLVVGGAIYLAVYLITTSTRERTECNSLSGLFDVICPNCKSINRITGEGKYSCCICDSVLHYGQISEVGEKCPHCNKIIYIKGEGSTICPNCKGSFNYINGSDLMPISINSNKEDVEKVLGRPYNVICNTWYYDGGTIEFEDEKVSGWNNIKGSLNISMGKTDPKIHPVSYGSIKEEVSMSLGTPCKIKGNRWYYKDKEIIFGDYWVTEVKEISNEFNNLVHETKSPYVDIANKININNKILSSGTRFARVSDLIRIYLNQHPEGGSSWQIYDFCVVNGATFSNPNIDEQRKSVSGQLSKMKNRGEVILIRERWYRAW